MVEEMEKQDTMGRLTLGINITQRPRSVGQGVCSRRGRSLKGYTAVLTCLIGFSHAAHISAVAVDGKVI